ncbi:hypothetical protein FLA_2175 [Filimonas lacunae]|nr:hypothetical protein FLA_2175 [Filimonas lacunae]
MLEQPFEQSSMIAVNDRYWSVWDTTWTPDGEETIGKQVFQIRKDSLVAVDSSTVIDTTLNYKVLAVRTGDYQLVPDTAAASWVALKKKHPDIYQAKDMGAFVCALASSLNECSLQVYRQNGDRIDSVALGSYDFYAPQLLLHDFDKDGVPEILVLANFYVHNHFLNDVRAYTIKKRFYSYENY